MIGGLHQRYYKNAIINVLKAWGGEAYGRDVIDALISAPQVQVTNLPYGESLQPIPLTPFP